MLHYVFWQREKINFSRIWWRCHPSAGKTIASKTSVKPYCNLILYVHLFGAPIFRLETRFCISCRKLKSIVVTLKVCQIGIADNFASKCCNRRCFKRNRQGYYSTLFYKYLYGQKNFKYIDSSINQNPFRKNIFSPSLLSSCYAFIHQICLYEPPFQQPVTLEFTSYQISTTMSSSLLKTFVLCYGLWIQIIKFFLGHA